MKRLVLAGLAGLLVTAAAVAQAQKTAPAAKPAVKAPAEKKAAPAKGPTETVAVLQTKDGKIVIKFFPDKARPLSLEISRVHSAPPCTASKQATRP